MATNSSLYKGSLATIILKLLNENVKMYGYEMTQKVKLITEGQLNLTEGALYPALHKLEADGLITSSMENIGNRMRKYYSITRTGKKEMKERLLELQSFFQQMQNLLSIKIA